MHIFIIVFANIDLKLMFIIRKFKFKLHNIIFIIRKFKFKLHNDIDEIKLKFVKFSMCIPSIHNLISSQMLVVSP